MSVPPAALVQLWQRFYGVSFLGHLIFHFPLGIGGSSVAFPWDPEGSSLDSLISFLILAMQLFSVRAFFGSAFVKFTILVPLRGRRPAT